jgi:hypothetical protein
VITVETHVDIMNTVLSRDEPHGVTIFVNLLNDSLIFSTRWSYNSSIKFTLSSVKVNGESGRLVYLKAMFLKVMDVKLPCFPRRWSQIHFERRVWDILIVKLDRDKIFTRFAAGVGYLTRSILAILKVNLCL